MTIKLSFMIPGMPGHKRRHRSVMTTRGMRQYTPAETVAWERTIAQFARAAAQTQGVELPMRGPLMLHVSAIYPRPKRAIGLWKTTKPDLDNVIKSVMDGMNGVIYNDDNQIACIWAGKRLATHEDQPGVRIVVEVMNNV